MCPIWKWKKTEPPKNGREPGDKLGDAVETAVEEHAQLLNLLLDAPLPVQGAWAFSAGLTLMVLSYHMMAHLRSVSALAVAMLMLVGLLFYEFRRVETLRLEPLAPSAYVGPLIAIYGILAYALLTYFHPAW